MGVGGGNAFLEREGANEPGAVPQRPLGTLFHHRKDDLSINKNRGAVKMRNALRRRMLGVSRVLMRNPHLHLAPFDRPTV